MSKSLDWLNVRFLCASFVVSCLISCTLGIAQAGTLFTVPDGYDFYIRDVGTAVTIDNGDCWFNQDGVLQAAASRPVLELADFGSIRSRYKNVNTGLNYVVGSGTHSSNTGWVINGSNLYIVKDVARSWYSGAPTEPNLTMLSITIAGLPCDGRMHISGGGSLNQSAGTLTLNHGSMHVGDSGVGTYNLEGGAFTISNTASTSSHLQAYDFYVGSSSSTPGTAGTGTFNIAGGTAILPGKIYVGEASNAGNTGTINQTGGLVNASGLNINNGSYTFIGGSLQLTDTMLPQNTQYEDKTYNIQKDVTMAGGVFNLGASGVAVKGEFTGNLTLSGDAQFNLNGGGVGSNFGGTDTVVTISDSASFTAGTSYVANGAGQKVTFNLSDNGTLNVYGNSAIAEYGTFIVNQTGGEYKAGGYGANNGPGVFEMNLSGGIMTGTFQALSTRGTTTMNISGDYQWTFTGDECLQHGFDGATATVSQNGADSLVKGGSFSVGKVNGTGTAEYNLSAGTLELDSFFSNNDFPNVTGTLNIGDSGVAKIGTITDIGLNVTGGTLDLGALNQSRSKSTIAGGNVSINSITLNDGAELELVYGDNFTPISIGTSLSGTDNISLQFADDFEMVPGLYMLFKPKEGALIDISNIRVGDNSISNSISNLAEGFYVAIGQDGTVSAFGTPNSLPEPATWVILVLGALGIVGIKRFKK